jgi:hypothetical protein
MGKFDLITTCRGHPLLIAAAVAIILLLAILIAYGAQNACTPFSGRFGGMQWESQRSAVELQGEGRRWAGSSAWNCFVLGFAR